MTSLEDPLANLALPPRMVAYARSESIVTVGELAKRHPSALLLEPGLGRGTVSETRLAIEQALGMPWEEAAQTLRGDDLEDELVSVAIAPAALGWNGLRAVLPRDVRGMRIEHSPLPTRLASYARARGFVELDELLSVSELDLRDAPHLGSSQVRAAVAALLRLREGAAAEVRATDWRRRFVGALGRLPVRERMILTQRAGLLGPPPSLVELGESLGLSRERVRQAEHTSLATVRAEAGWVSPLGEAMRAAFPAFACRLSDVVCDGVPLVTDAETDGHVLAYVLEHVLTGEGVFVFAVDGVTYAARVPETRFSARLSALRQACEVIALPTPSLGFESTLARAAGLAPQEEAVLLDLVLRDFRASGERVTAYAPKSESEVLALLRAAGRPMALSRIVEVFGRRRLPSEVVWLDKGLVTLPELVPGFFTWRSRIGPLVAQIIAESGERRQWTCAELLPVLSTVADLPEWMNEYALGSLLREAEGILYLGRERVELGDAPATARVFVNETVEDVLLAASGPLEEAELLRRVRETRDVSDAMWNMQRSRAPFVLLGSGRVGLSPRDVPGGEESAKALCDALFEWLERRETGVGPYELLPHLASLGPPFSTWDVRLVRSLLRHDPRFRQAQGGGLGLTVWGETRTKSQRETLEALLGKSGWVKLAEAREAVVSATGEPLPKARLAMLAQGLGARVLGDDIRRDPQPLGLTVPDLPPDYRNRIPEKASSVFARCLVAPRSVDELREAVRGWYHDLVRSGAPSLDLEQVRRLANQADRMLVGAASGGQERERAIRAAVEYLVCVTDGESDWVVGGLDDDEAVLAAVATG